MKSVFESVPPIAAGKPAFNGARIEEDSWRVSQINQLFEARNPAMLKGIVEQTSRPCE